MRVAVVCSVLSIVFLAAVAACGGDVKSSRYVLRVDSAIASGGAAGLKLPTEPIPDASYTAVEPRDRYEVVIAGDRVTIVPIGAGGAGGGGGGAKMEGSREASSSTGAAGEKRFRLDTGVFAGGAFVVRGGRGELTVYGSGVPIVSSERGDLVTR